MQVSEWKIKLQRYFSDYYAILSGAKFHHHSGYKKVGCNLNSFGTPSESLQLIVNRELIKLLEKSLVNR